jgi:hypothetical protein
MTNTTKIINVDARYMPIHVLKELKARAIRHGLRICLILHEADDAHDEYDQR